MKKLFLLSALALSMLFTSCADSQKFTNENSTGETQTVKVESYGLFNQDDKIAGVDYQVCVGNVVLSVIFSETIVVPIILCGWHLWEPIEVTDKELVFKKSNE